MTDKKAVPTEERDDARTTLFHMFARAALAADHCLSDGEYALGWSTSDDERYHQLLAWRRARRGRPTEPATVVGAVLSEVGALTATEAEIDAEPLVTDLYDKALDFWIGRKFGRLDDTTFHKTGDPSSPGITWGWICAETMPAALICSGVPLNKYIERQEDRSLGDLRPEKKDP